MKKKSIDKTRYNTIYVDYWDSGRMSSMLRRWGYYLWIVDGDGGDGEGVWRRNHPNGFGYHSVRVSIYLRRDLYLPDFQ
jgi:hypothetical protein